MSEQEIPYYDSRDATEHTPVEDGMIEVSHEEYEWMVRNNMIPAQTSEMTPVESADSHFDFELKISGRAPMAQIHGVMQQNGLAPQQPVRTMPFVEQYPQAAAYVPPRTEVVEPYYDANTYGGLDPQVARTLIERDRADSAQRETTFASPVSEAVIVTDEFRNIDNTTPNRAPKKKSFHVKTVIGAIALISSAAIMAGPYIHRKEAGVSVAESCNLNPVCKIEQFIPANAKNIFNFTPAKDIE